MQKHLVRAHYKFDCRIAELRGEPAPEDPATREAREQLEALKAPWRVFGEALREMARRWSAIVEAVFEGMRGSGDDR